MRCAYSPILVFLFLCFAGDLVAQHSVKKNKGKKANTADLIQIYQKKKLVFTFTRAAYNHFRDSINHQTRDGLHKISDQKIEWKPAQAQRSTTSPPVNIALSAAVFIDKQGYVSISLPDAATHHYRLVFYADMVELFGLDVNESGLILDKSNFVHAGWFRYELFDEDKLVGRNKFFLPR